MSTTTRYDIEANLSLTGVDDLKEKTDEAADAIKQLKGGIKELSSFGREATSHLLSAGSALMAFGAVGAAIGSKLAHGVGQGMLELEDKSLQLSTIVAAASETPFAQAQAASGALFEQFRTDAIRSAGATADYVDVASKLAGAIFGAGKGMSELHEMTGLVVGSAQSFGTTFEQAGSDMMRMLQGGAGSEQPLFRAMVGIPSLGIKKAEEFNKLTSVERFDKLSNALKNPAFLASVEKTGESMTGLLSTAEDIASTIGSSIGGQLYGMVKEGLGWLTDSANKLLADPVFIMRLSRIGGEAEVSFRRIAHMLGKVFPDFNSGANSALDLLTDLSIQGLGKLEEGSKWIVDHWSEIKAFASETKDLLVDMAKHAKTFVETIGGGDFATGAQRLAGAMTLNAAAPTAISVGKAGYDVAKGAYGFVAAGGISSAVSSVSAGATAIGTAAMGSGMVPASVAAAGALASVAAIAGAAVLALGGLALAADQAVKLYDFTEGGKTDEERNIASYQRAMENAAKEGNVKVVEELSVRYEDAVREMLDHSWFTSGASSVTQYAGAQTYSQQMVDQAKGNRRDIANRAETELLATDLSTPAEKLVDIYNTATEQQDMGMAELAARTIVMSGQTAASLEQGGLKLAGGLGLFGKYFEGAAGDVGEMFLRFQHLKPPSDISGKGKTPSSSGTTVGPWRRQ